MSSPLNADEATRLFKIFGIPQNGTGFVAARIISLYGPGGNVYDFSALVTQLNALLNNVTSSQYTQIQNMLTEWENITDYSELTVSADNNSQGRLVDHDLRRRNIRRTLSNIIGFYVPLDGFFTDASAASQPRVLR
jgi:hypothetical protein